MGMREEAARKTIIEIVKQGLVMVDQGMGHHHFKMELHEGKCKELVECLTILDPDGKIRVQGPISL